MDTVKTLLLRRQGLVFLAEDPRLMTDTQYPELTGAVKVWVERQSLGPAIAKLAQRSAAALAPLEHHLLTLGYLMQADLQHRLRILPPAEFTAVSDWLGATLALDPDRPTAELHPTNALKQYRQGVLAAVSQCAEQPCLSCGCRHVVIALSACGHLLCSPCWAGAIAQICPICEHSLAPPVQSIVPPAIASLASDALKVLHLGRDQPFAVQSLLHRWLLRPTELLPLEQADLQLLVRGVPELVRAGLPQRIPVPETLALLLGTLLQHPPDRAGALALAQTYRLTTPDVLRLILVWSGGAADFSAPPRLRSMPRSLRRGILALLEAVPVAQLIQDMQRQRSLWQRVGAILHPFEFHRRYPNCALAFAVVRRTRIDSAAVTLPADAVEPPASLTQTLLTTAPPLTAGPGWPLQGRGEG